MTKNALCVTITLLNEYLHGLLYREILFQFLKVKGNVFHLTGVELMFGLLGETVKDQLSRLIFLGYLLADSCNFRSQCLSPYSSWGREQNIGSINPMFIYVIA
jgi:hypothetical protein